MLPYWLLFGGFAVGAMHSQPLQSRRSAIGYFVAALVLMITIGLRDRVGGDWYAYVDIFYRVQHLSLAHSVSAIEPAYALVNWLVARAGLGVWAVNFVCASIFTLGLLRFSKDQPLPNLALVVAIPYLVIVVAMGYTRQSAALGIILVALSCYFKGSTVRMVVLLVISVMFHKSAVVMIPLISLAMPKNRLLTFILLSIVAAATFYLFVYSSVDRLMDNYVSSRYSSSGAGIRIAMNLVPATIFLAFRRKFTTNKEELLIWTVFSIASIISLILLLTTPSSTAVDRMALYLIPLQLFVLSRMPIAFSVDRFSDIYLKALVIIYSAAVQFTWLNYADNSFAWIPYRNYLTEFVPE